MIFSKIVAIIAITWSLFQLYTAGFGFFHVMIQRPVHVALALGVAFLTYPMVKAKTKEVMSDEDAPKNAKITWFDFLLSAIAIGIGAYMILNSERIISRVYFVDKVFIGDVIVGIILVLLVLEAGRRVVGWILPVIAIIFLGYQFFGPNLSGLLRHGGVSLPRFFDMQLLSPNGLFGTPTGVSTDTVFYFILFAVFLEVSGGGKFFVDMAVRATGRFRGGPAKAAIVGSSLMGTINGSAVANAVGSGVFTIPLMKRCGYPPIFAAAVEAVASTGGQIMPPIMGAAAFVMAEMLGVPYTQVVVAAIIPAVAFYAAIFIAVDLKAKQDNLKGMDLSELPSFGEDIRKKAHLAIPLVVLIYILFSGRSLMMAAFVATLITIPVGWMRKETRIGFADIIYALETGAKKAVVVAVPCVIAGIIVGVVTFSGLGLKFSALLISFSGGNVLLALVMVMLCCIVLGMGMPTTAAYIIAAVLMAPTLINLGIQPIAAHMFVFYFACLSMITPPIALAAYATAGIAETDPMKTGFAAWFLATNGFIIPFAFVRSNALLLMGTPSEIAWVVSFMLLGIYSLAKAVILDKLPKWLRGVFGVAALLLIDPDITSDVAGIVILTIALLFQKRFESARKVNSDVNI